MTSETLRAGDRLGPFRLDRRLALGGMAEVWIARAAHRPRPLALKIMLPELARDPDFRRMFRDEVRLARLLKHPNILEVYQAYASGGSVFLAMELIDGIDLRRLLIQLTRSGQWMPVPLALSVGQSLGRALDYAHNLRDERGRPLRIVHRDVSPHNVMIARDGSVRLLDFGIARATERLTHTMTGVVKGKLAYMAPEQALAREVGPAADMFSTGIVLWETLAMRRLFRGKNEPETLRKVLKGEIPSVREVNSVVPRSVAALIGQMLERDVSARPRSMADVEARLSAILPTLYPSERWTEDAMRVWLEPYLAANAKRGTRPLEEDTAESSGARTRAEALGRPTERVSDGD